MCGIAGLISFAGAPHRSHLEAMTGSLAHRGPDGEGVAMRDNAGLGHRRLSIIDLESGRQPLFNEDGQVAVTFNGEIYNFRELRRELEAAGHTFKTHADTEVLVHGWEQWGADCVHHLRGMFAFCIVDWRRRTAFLARDHFGIKPLCYSLTRDRFAFASELQALRVLPDFDDTIDVNALDSYLTLQYVPAPLSIFRGARKLAPAHRMTVSFDGTVTGPERYWDLEFRPHDSRSEAEWTEALAAVVQESVQTHLVADVPFGAFLSGGIDSTAVVSAMAKELGKVTTFTIGFSEAAYNELEFARTVAKRWSTDHHEEIVTPNALEILPTLVRHYGEPFGDSSAIPTYYVSRLARRHVPMVLSGDGGDEAFGGYASYLKWLAWLESPAPERPLWKRAVRPVAARLWPGRFPEDSVSRKPTAAKWQAMVSLMPAAFRRRLWRPEYAHAVSPVDASFENAFSDWQPDPLALVRHADYRTYLPFDVLTKVDVAAMCHGLEVRTPLIDLRVAEFAATIPSRFLVGRDARTQAFGKRVLRNVVAKDFGPDFLDRPKMGFGVPIAEWFAPEGALRGELESRLAGGRLREFFRPAVLRQTVAAHGRTANAAGPLWLLFFLDAWLAEAPVKKVQA